MSYFKTYENLANLLHAVCDNNLSFIKANLKPEFLNLHNILSFMQKKDIVKFLLNNKI